MYDAPTRLQNTARTRLARSLAIFAAVWFLALASVSLCGCSTATQTSSASDTPTTISDKKYDPDAALKNATGEAYWNAILEKYRNDASVHQILLVKYEGESNATSQFYVKAPAESSGWSLVFEDDSYVGQDGAGTASSSSSTTPMGDFAILEAFGILSNPGTTLPYVQVTDTIYASCECSENCPYFNTIHDVAQNGHWECSGEHMIDCAPDYNYGLNFDYNPEKDFYKGSAFFVHCKGRGAYTGGCIALDQEHMVTILTQATSGMRVVIANA